MRYTLQLGYKALFEATVSVEAGSVEEACRAGIELAGGIDAWKSAERVSDAFVAAIVESGDETGDGTAGGSRQCPVPVPDEYSESGPPPVLTIQGAPPSGAMEISGGTVCVRIVADNATVASEISDPPPDPLNKPLVIVRPRTDGAPDIEVRGGKARIRIEGWPDQRRTAPHAALHHDPNRGYTPS